ncbi:hypothetical protein [Massilia phosphatilytica]
MNVCGTAQEDAPHERRDSALVDVARVAGVAPITVSRGEGSPDLVQEAARPSNARATAPNLLAGSRSRRRAA